jgi:peptide/nickel transport system ATP-binding protein
MTSLDPAFTVGNHLWEAQRNHQDISRSAARVRSIELLDMVKIPAAESRLKAFPHELSGGMRQRVMIAIALACNPSLLIADEPTTALDVTIQAQVLGLLRELQRELNMSMLLVTHDLGVIADVCDDVAVMYAGQIVERSSATELFDAPNHPYSEGLLRSMPRLDRRLETLEVIPGSVASPQDMPAGCRFHTRCAYAVDECRAHPVPLRDTTSSSMVRCIRADELSLVGSLALSGGVPGEVTR